jgi:hypothetical protein
MRLKRLGVRHVCVVEGCDVRKISVGYEVQSIRVK